MKICGQNTNILNSNILNTTVKTQKFVNVLQIFFFQFLNKFLWILFWSEPLCNHCVEAVEMKSEA